MPAAASFLHLCSLRFSDFRLGCHDQPSPSSFLGEDSDAPPSVGGEVDGYGIGALRMFHAREESLLCSALSREFGAAGT